MALLTTKVDPWHFRSWITSLDTSLDFGLRVGGGPKHRSDDWDFEDAMSAGKPQWFASSVLCACAKERFSGWNRHQGSWVSHLRQLRERLGMVAEALEDAVLAVRPHPKAAFYTVHSNSKTAENQQSKSGATSGESVGECCQFRITARILQKKSCAFAPAVSHWTLSQAALDAQKGPSQAAARWTSRDRHEHTRADGSKVCSARVGDAGGATRLSPYRHFRTIYNLTCLPCRLTLTSHGIGTAHRTTHSMRLSAVHLCREHAASHARDRDCERQRKYARDYEERQAELYREYEEIMCVCSGGDADEGRTTGWDWRDHDPDNCEPVWKRARCAGWGSTRSRTSATRMGARARRIAGFASWTRGQGSVRARCWAERDTWGAGSAERVRGARDGAARHRALISRQMSQLIGWKRRFQNRNKVECVVKHLSAFLIERDLKKIRLGWGQYNKSIGDSDSDIAGKGQ
ncbi:hypothetical protein C8R45DRAFT_928897 [Mycena sanguinolenta]|nr:hypothetical protein C8R45DRAFT_928897 [Mycena sanguinolenta]